MPEPTQTDDEKPRQLLGRTLDHAKLILAALVVIAFCASPFTIHLFLLFKWLGWTN